MLQVLAPAGSAEAVIAAVQSGADMVYMGFGASGAGQNGQGFSPEELARCLRYCRVRGCGAAVTIGELATDRSVDQAVERAVQAARQGAQALVVRDVGLISILRRVLPDVPLWGSARMDIHSLDGVLAAAAMGLRRVLLAPELTDGQIAAIARSAPIETAVLVHGPMCCSHMGQCYMSALDEGPGCESALRCAEPCRGRFSLGGRMDGDCPLSTPDICLIDHLDALESAGVTCAVIGGRGRRPEYVAYVTGLYSRAARQTARPTQEERERLEELFAPYGLTDGCYTGAEVPAAARPSDQPDRAAGRAVAEIRKGYMDGELRRVPVSMYAVLRHDRKAMFAAEDDRGHRAVHEGYIPPGAARQGVTAARVEEILYRTGGTPYSCTGVRCAVEPHLDYTDAALEDARRSLLGQITAQNRRPAPVAVEPPPEPPALRRREGGTLFNIQITREEQLTPELAEAAPDMLYIPAELLAAGPAGLEPFRARGARLTAVLPRVVTDEEKPVLRELLAAVRGMGASDALIGSVSLLPAVLEAGLRPRGDFSLDTANVWTARRLADIGLLSVTASVELSAAETRRLAMAADTEMIVYGRVPVMLTERCLIRAGTGRCSCATPTSMGDAKGGVYPVEKEFGCRSVVYDARKIFLADRPAVYENAGLWAVRLLFTTESARECADVALRYRGRNGYSPNNTGRGSYAKGAL